MGMDIPPTYIPLFDLGMPLEARRLAFLHKWIGYYFVHGDLSKCDIALLDQGYNNGSNRKNTFPDNSKISPKELADIVDFNPGPRCDDFLLQSFMEAKRIITAKALFDASTRSAWGGMDIWNLVGDSSVPTIEIGTWLLRDRAQAMQQQLCTIHFSVVQGVNHFVRFIFELCVCLVETHMVYNFSANVGRSGRLHGRA